MVANNEPVSLVLNQGSTIWTGKTFILGSNDRSQHHLRDDSDVRYIVHPGDVEEEDIIDFRLAGSNRLTTWSLTDVEKYIIFFFFDPVDINNLDCSKT